jgi:hypothetical protein
MPNSPARLIGYHLDLKGTQFKPDYGPQLLDDLASQGINAILIEYEDMFPYVGVDIAYDRATVWSKKTLAQFLARAKRNGIDVIPLQQSLAHFEYLFRWQRYRKFALNAAYPSTVNVRDPKAKAFIRGLLQQVLDAHGDSKYIHLGMDEGQLTRGPKAFKHSEVLDTFFSYLHEVLDWVKPSGIKPMIASDMLEDHFDQPARFKGLADKVILTPWDYGTTASPWTQARIDGNRVSKQWLDEPDNMSAPGIGDGTPFFEDWSPTIKKIVKPFMTPDGKRIRGIVQADLWKTMGFTCVGMTGVRSSWHLTVMPRFVHQLDNIKTWCEVAKRTNMLGVIATSWARGTSFCPPNFSVDLTWHTLGRFSEGMGGKPKPFFAGVELKKVDRIVKTLGRCRVDWSREATVIKEMRSLTPKLKSHRYEWESLALSAELFSLRRRLEYYISEVEYFHSNHRPNEGEWVRRLADQASGLKEIAVMRKRLVTHFGKRFYGQHFEEWIVDVLDLHERRLKECRVESRRKLKLARKVYSR